MIPVRRLSGEEIMINPHLIELIESTPDTVISFTNGRKIMVQDSVDSIVAKIIEYRKLIGDRNFTDYDGVS
ncbi:MAG TPA: flagellar FlbD family protein [Bacillota bacterium]|nr:flagellar FlbD family protein [Bacillota bacterium]HOL10016.1 flagellar FlbD family protein [Bacillota bacterium]HPO97766.1 flagellar FlbD family protein [Bacillota bacterium]